MAKILSDAVVEHLEKYSPYEGVEIFHRVATNRPLSEGQKRALAEAEAATKKVMGRPVLVFPADNAVANLRREKNWSQKKTAQELGISQGSVSLYECGKAEIPEKIKKLCELLQNA